MEHPFMERKLSEILKERPSLSREFDLLGFDYCCGGEVTLAEACRAKGLDPEEVAVLLGVDADAGVGGNPAALGLADLTDHIQITHHGYLKDAIPRLDALTEKVARVHGKMDSRLVDLREEFKSLASEMLTHMQKEEEILFPLIRRLEKEAEVPNFHCGYLVNPVSKMENEHEDATLLMANIRLLAGGFEPPDWACNTYRAMLRELQALEIDLEEHIRKEETLLFPRALELEIYKLSRE